MKITIEFDKEDIASIMNSLIALLGPKILQYLPPIKDLKDLNLEEHR